MLNKGTEARAFKDAAYGSFADLTKAMSSPRRLELLDLLIQGPRGVESLATGTGQRVATASQHLQVLRRAKVVDTTRYGTRIEYRLAPGVASTFVALRRLAELRSPALARAKQDFYRSTEAPDTIDRATLVGRLTDGSATLLDVRPLAEFAHGHIVDAVSIPIEELADRLAELPQDRLIVATCRGPYCVFAAEAVRVLRQSGRAAVRFEDGIAEWVADGGRLAPAAPA